MTRVGRPGYGRRTGSRREVPAMLTAEEDAQLTRVGPGTLIEFRLECLAAGMTIREIVEEYPTLTEEAVMASWSPRHQVLERASN